MTVLPLPEVQRRPFADPALLLVAHGSSDPRAAYTLDRLVRLVQASSGGLPVTLSFVDHADPSLSAAMDGYAAVARDVVAVPLLLSAAAHAKGDIPAAIRAARSRHPGLRVRYAGVLGPHPLLLAALNRRLAEAGTARAGRGRTGAGPAGTDQTDAVVLVAAGSADPDANAEVARTARLLWEWRRGGPVEPAFASATRPTVAEAVDRLRRLGHRRIALASYFLAPGRLLSIVDGVAAVEGLPVTAPLADTEEVAELVLRRYAEAVAPGGGLATAAHCDTCQYRTGWPGRAHRVGEPQRPHPHPSDRFRG
jgi:sirohydrochlorin cobaltochelatase